MKDKTVVVTGAGRGLGAALCLRFGREGAFVAGFDINQEALDGLARELTAVAIPHLLLACDITDEKQVARFFTRLRDEGRTVDVLINNAGITNIKLFRNNSNAEIMRVMDINFRGCVYTTREAYDDIVRNKGSFIAISSVAGFAPLIGRTAYAASKHAVLGFFETLRTELVDEGVHVLVVCPGFIDTELRAHTYREAEDNATTKHKVGSNASPAEIADMIYRATVKRRPMLVTGIGKASWWIKRLAPNLYERLMRNKLKAGFEG